MTRIITLGKVAVVIAVVGVAGAALTACNTIEGLGKDLSAVGKGISKGATDTKGSTPRSKAP